jgi:hypothetical protein
MHTTLQAYIDAHRYHLATQQQYGSLLAAAGFVACQVCDVTDKVGAGGTHVRVL